MKFFCDNCQAQYMISDEKVGPAGVRVRCKKCSHVIYVKRLDAEPPPEDATVVMTPERMASLGALEPTPSPASAIALPEGSDGAAGGAGLEDEIGQALDSMFSDGPTGPSPTSQVPAAPSHRSNAPVVLGSRPSILPGLPGAGLLERTADDSDRAETRIFSTTDMEKIAADSTPRESSLNGVTGGQGSSDAAGEEGGVQWFIAVRDEQVGPLTLDQIKDRFELGEVGGDTLVWSTGLTDWRPLSTVEELAEQILPKREITRSSRAPLPAVELPAKNAKPASKEAVAFKPSAASALASLASMAREEMAASERPAVPPPAAVPRAAAPETESNLDNAFLAGLPSPSPDLAPPPAAPAFVRVPVRGPSTASSVANDFQRSPLGQSASPERRSSNLRLIAAVAVGTLLLVALLAGGYYAAVVKPANDQALAAQQRRDAELKAAADKATAEKAAADKAAADKAAADKLAADKAAQAAAATTVAPAPTPPAPAPGPKVAAAPPDARDHRGAKKGSKVGKGNESAGPSASNEHAPAAPEKAPPPASKGGDDFLAAGDVDKEFAKELDGATGDSKPATRHAVYIPPPPGQGELPATLSQSVVVGWVGKSRDSFARCVQDQKKRDPNATGTLVMHWRIKPDGRVTDIRSDDADNPLAACFKTQIGKLHFPGYSGPQMEPIAFPFNY